MSVEFLKYKNDLDPKFYYEMFTDNVIWASIHIITDYLSGETNSDLFFEKFNEGVKDSRINFELKANEFVLRVRLEPLALSYYLEVYDTGVTNYKVTFENNCIGKDLEGKELDDFELQFEKVEKLLKLKKKSVEIVYKEEVF